MNPADLTAGSALYIVGDVRDVLATIPDHSIDLFVTSPPFLALRSYLPADHPDKHREIGSEPTPADFLDTLLELSAEWRRVLAPHGSIAVELGDTYSGSGVEQREAVLSGEARWGGENGAPTLTGFRGGTVARKGAGWPLDKSLTGIPTLYAWSLAYGRNLLREPFSAVELLHWIDGLRASGYTAEAALAAAGGWVAEHGEPQRFAPWRVRNLIPWVRPNPPVGALGDKCRPATSYITVATLARDRWWDMEDCRTEHQVDPATRSRWTVQKTGARRDDENTYYTLGHPAGAPLLDWWQIPTAPYPGAHYATFPSELPARLTKLMCPRQVCRQCGLPRRRMGSNAFGLQPELAAHIKERREALGLTSADVNAWFGYKEIATNWERLDPWGARVPNAKDWAILKDRLGLSDSFDHFVLGRDPRHVSYVDETGQTLAPEERRTAYDRGGTPGTGSRIKARRQASDDWTDCGHDDYRPGIVLDPFAGTGTTLAAATGLGRAAIGIDLDHRNVDLARQRCGMFLEVAA